MRNLFGSALAVSLFAAFVACGPFPKPDASTIIECATQDSAQLAGLAMRLEPLLYGDRPDWAALEREAENAGVSIGGCVLADLVNQWLSRPRATDETMGAWQTLEAVRRSFGGGVKWRVAGDVL